MSGAAHQNGHSATFMTGNRGKRDLAVDCAAPLLGQHTADILTELGYSESEQRSLWDGGIIQ